MNDKTTLDADITLRPTDDRRRCFHFEASDCPFNINHAAEVTLDAKMHGCNDTWPRRCGWFLERPTQHQSGEIDLVETCCGETNASFARIPTTTQYNKGSERHRQHENGQGERRCDRLVLRGIEAAPMKCSTSATLTVYERKGYGGFEQRVRHGRQRLAQAADATLNADN